MLNESRRKRACVRATPGKLHATISGPACQRRITLHQFVSTGILDHRGCPFSTTLFETRIAVRTKAESPDLFNQTFWQSF